MMIQELVSSVANESDPVGSLYVEVFDSIGSSTLSQTTANWIREFTKAGFSRYRSSYDSKQFDRIAAQINVDASPSQAFFCLYSLPNRCLDPRVVVQILRLLFGTSFESEAFANLEDEFDCDVVRLVAEWSKEDSTILDSPNVKNVILNASI
jgi:uncharacterized protein YecE (DUF72 family)